MTDTDQELKKKSDIIQIRIDIQGKTKMMFKKLQEKYNISRYTDTFRLIVKRAYDLDIGEPLTEE